MKTYDSQGHAPRQSERETSSLRSRRLVKRLETAAARCSGSGHNEATWEIRAQNLGNMPEVSEIEIIRHFTRLSTGTMRSISGCIRWARAR